MDALDHRLLSELTNNGHERIAFLAKRLNIGERTVRRRISTMRDNGLVKFIGVPNPVLFGYAGWAKIGIRIEAGTLYDVARQLVLHPSIYFVAITMGGFDILVATHFYTVDELKDFVNLELTRMRGIESTETMMLLGPRKYYNFRWPASNSRGNHKLRVSSSVPPQKAPYQIDEVDRKILGILMQDGLARPSEMKQHVGLQEAAIRKRVKNMASHEIFKIQAVPDREVLEYEAWATMGINTNYRFNHSSLESLVESQAIYLISPSLGRFNLIIAARFHNMDSLTHFVKTELQKMSGVTGVEIFLHTQPLKYHNIDWVRPDILNLRPKRIESETI